MRIAITGHKKGIGQEFTKQLAQQGHDIVGISRSDGENSEQLEAFIKRQDVLRDISIDDYFNLFPNLLKNS